MVATELAAMARTVMWLTVPGQLLLRRIAGDILYWGSWAGHHLTWHLAWHNRSIDDFVGYLWLVDLGTGGTDDVPDI